MYFYLSAVFPLECIGGIVALTKCARYCKGTLPPKAKQKQFLTLWWDLMSRGTKVVGKLMQMLERSLPDLDIVCKNRLYLSIKSRRLYT